MKLRAWKRKLIKNIEYRNRNIKGYEVYHQNKKSSNKTVEVLELNTKKKGPIAP